MKAILPLIVLMVCLNDTYGQASAPCNCSALVDPDFEGKIELYEKPGGRSVRTMQHNFENSDFLILSIKKDSAGYFYVEISYALTTGSEQSFWIKKTKEIGTYARNYQENDSLKLYSKPDTASMIKVLVPEWTNQLLPISKCFQEWAYVRFEYQGEVKEGWLHAKQQRSNPYTTCT